MPDIPSDLDRDVWIDFEPSKGLERGTEVNANFIHGGLKGHGLRSFW